MSNSIAPGSSADVNVRVTALTTNPNVPAQYKTIILKKNLVNGVNTLTQEMMPTANTKYVVKYDYVLGEDIDVPNNCILEFDGGSLSGNSGIEFNNTLICGTPNIQVENVSGTLSNKEVYLSWFTATDFSNIIENLSNGLQIMHIDKNVTCKRGINLYCNTSGNGVISFESSEYIIAAVNAVGEFDIDELHINCSGISVCKQGFLHNKTYNSTRQIKHNISVKNNINTTDNTKAVMGVCYSHHSNMDYNGFNVVLKCDIQNICGCQNGIVGDEGGSASGLELVFINTNVTDNKFIVENSYIYNIYDSTDAAEDSDALHILDNCSGSSVIIKDSVIKYGTKRCIKIQGNGPIVSNCIIDMDGADNKSSTIGIDIMASNNTIIEGCKVIGEHTGGHYGILSNGGVGSKIQIKDTLVALDNGYNLIRVQNAGDNDIDVVLFSNRTQNSTEESAIYINNSGNTKINAHIDIKGLTFVFSEGNKNGNVTIQATGYCKYGVYCNYNPNYITIQNSDIVCTETFIYSILDNSDVKNLRILNSKIKGKIFVWGKYLIDPVFDNNIFECTDDGVVAIIILGAGTTNTIISNNKIIGSKAVKLLNISGCTNTKFIDNYFESSLAGLIIDSTYVKSYYIGNKFKIDDAATFDILATSIKHENVNVETGTVLSL